MLSGRQKRSRIRGGPPVWPGSWEVGGFLRACLLQACAVQVCRGIFFTLKSDLDLGPSYPPDSPDKWLETNGALYVQRGSAIRLNCTITKPLACGADSIWFRRNNTPVGASKVTVLPDNRTAIMALPNADFNESVSFHCALRAPCDTQHTGYKVDVGVPPQKPVLGECVIKAWSTLHCDWTPSQKQQLDHANLGLKTSRLEGVPLAEPGESTPIECVDLVADHSSTRPETCDQKLDAAALTRRVNITIHAGNTIGSTASDPVVLDFREIVKPTAVERSGIRTEYVNDTVLRVRWTTPVPAHYRQLVPDLRLDYTVGGQFSYTSDPERGTQRLEPVYATGTEVTLVIQPHAEYRLSISSRVLPRGPHSDAVTFTEQTPPQVPSANPTVVQNAFLTGFSKEHETRTVTVYWNSLQLPDQNGPGLGYTVDASPVGDLAALIQKKTSLTYTSLELETGTEYRVTVRAYNDIGSSTVDTYSLLLPAETDMVPGVDVRAFIVQGEKETALFQWDSVEEAAFYTLYICLHNHELICKRELRSVRLIGDQTQYNWTLPGEYHHYMFGIAAISSAGHASYMTVASCNYDRTAKPKPVPFVSVSTQGLDYSEARVTWGIPTCDTKSGYPNTIIVYYCQSVDGECDLEEDLEVEILSGSMTGITLGFLTQGATYNISVQTMTQLNMTGSLYTKIVQIPKNWRSSGTILGISLAVFISMGLIMIGVKASAKVCRKCWKKYTGMTIQLPEHAARVMLYTQPHPITSTSSDAPFLAHMFDSSTPVASFSHGHGEFSYPRNDETEAMMAGYTRASPGGRGHTPQPRPGYGLHSDSDGDDDVFDSSQPHHPRTYKVMGGGDSGHADSGLGADSSAVETPYSTVKPSIRVTDINSNMQSRRLSGSPPRDSGISPYTPMNSGPGSKVYTTSGGSGQSSDTTQAEHGSAVPYYSPSTGNSSDHPQKSSGASAEVAPLMGYVAPDSMAIQPVPGGVLSPGPDSGHQAAPAGTYTNSTPGVSSAPTGGVQAGNKDGGDHAPSLQPLDHVEAEPVGPSSISPPHLNQGTKSTPAQGGGGKDPDTAVGSPPPAPSATPSSQPLVSAPRETAIPTASPGDGYVQHDDVSKLSRPPMTDGPAGTDYVRHPITFQNAGNGYVTRTDY